MKVVYFVGTGASKSIDDRVPMINDFFEKVIDLMIETDVGRLTFASAEEARAFFR